MSQYIRISLIVFICTILLGVNQTILYAQDILDCQSDVECFMNAAGTCSAAKLDHRARIKTQELWQTTSWTKTIEGLQEERCLVSTKINDIQISFSDELRQRLKNDGVSEKKIKQRVKESNEWANQAFGREGTCLWNIDQLKEYLNNIKVGNYSFTHTAECRGPMFEINTTCTSHDHCAEGSKCKNYQCVSTSKK